MRPKKPSLLILWIFASVLIGYSPLALSQAKVRRNVQIEWDAIEDAKFYEIEIVRKDDQDKKPQRFKLEEPKWLATIKPGRYAMRIRSFDDRGVPGDWGQPTDLIVKLPAIIVTEPLTANVQAKETDQQDVTLKWEVIPGAEKYRINAKSPINEWSSQVESETNQATIQMPVGQIIEWNVLAIDDQGEPGEVSPENYKFVLIGPALDRPKIIKPISKFLREMKWDPSPHARDYDVELTYFNPTTKKWISVDKKEAFTETTLKLDIARPSGRYRLKVQANGERRLRSKPAILEYKMRGGFQNPDALETAILRDSIIKPTNYYAIASYMITNISYVSVDRETNTKPTFPALGGTGRIGLAYQRPQSSWGTFVIGDLSGFIINGHNFKFTSIEAHATSKIELGQKGILLVTGGVFSKELPIVKGTNQFGFASVGKVRNIGPHIGLKYWLPLNDRYGIQANLRSYYSILGQASNGKKIISTTSLQYGLLGSYRVNRNWMGYLGYAYRLDQAKFQAVSRNEDQSSFAQDGEQNSVTIKGHYLNLALEFSF